jgi:phosphohistidine swiveling domain-containing protein
MTLGAVATVSERPRAFFSRELDDAAIRGWKTTLAGTEFAAAFQVFLDEFGHRGPYESDVMSARFAEDPAPVLRVIQLYVKADAIEDPIRHAAERTRIRQAAMDVVRVALRQGQGRLAFTVRWAAFSIMRGALQRLLALRDECRHVMTMMVAHLRQISLEIGRRATSQGLLASADDVFFLHWEELPRILVDRQPDWRDITRRRRSEREQNAQYEAPDLLASGEQLEHAPTAPSGDELVGLGVSPGTVVGTVKILREVTDIRRLSGEIIVVPAVEPTLTPIFPLIVGMVAEMGGLLSHAAILAREYGLPAVVSVPGATRWLQDGDRIELDGATGRIRILQTAGPRPRAGQESPGHATQPDPSVREEVRRDEDPDGRARQNVGDVVTLEVDAPEGHGGRERVEKPAQARVVDGEDGGHGEHRGRVAGRERVDALSERGAKQRGARQPGVRSRTADEVLEGELQQPGGGKGQRGERGRILKPGPAEGTARQAEDQAGHEQRHAVSNGVDRADHHVEHEALPLDGPGGDVVVKRQRGGRDEQGHTHRG